MENINVVNTDYIIEQINGTVYLEKNIYLWLPEIL